MSTGFDTIGKAIVICYDDGPPVLVTDPWITRSADFDSWGFSHEIPDERVAAILSTLYVWLLHGHPDYLQAESLEQLRNRKILLPDHVGRRISDALKEQGFDVHTMTDRQWYPLSAHIKALCISDFTQDAILLVDIRPAGIQSERCQRPRMGKFCQEDRQAI